MVYGPGGPYWPLEPAENWTFTVLLSPVGVRGDLNESRCRRLVVGSVTVPFHDQAVRAIDFELAAGDRSPSKAKVERAPRPRSRHEMKRWMASLAWS